jgi:hypothetical protein
MKPTLQITRALGILVAMLSATAAWTAPAARIPISQPTSFPIVISQPGYYVFTGNITGQATFDGIQVTADDVTIDLQGYSLLGVAEVQDGINVAGSDRVTVINGTIRNWQNGIFALGNNGCVFRELKVSENRDDGINGGLSCFVDRCVVIFNNSEGANGGIQTGHNSIVQYCVASHNTSGTSFGSATGIETGNYCTVTGCTSNDNDGHGASSGTGIRTGDGCTITGNTCSLNDAGPTAGGGFGIEGNLHCIISKNTCNDNKGTGGSSNGYGIYADNLCSVFDNVCSGNTGTGAGSGVGIYAEPQVRIERNLCTDNTGPIGYGIRISNQAAGGCTIIKNTTSGNFTAGIRFDSLTPVNYCAENIIDEPGGISQPGSNVMGAGDLANVLF